MKNKVVDGLYFLAGGCLYSLSVNVFTAPAEIAPGGATGVATLLYALFDLPIGTTVMVLNIPLFVLAYFFLGRGFLAKTVIATALSSVLIDLTAPFIPVYTGNGLLAALYGGVLSGLGLSLVFLRGGTTGGTDIASKLLQKRFHSLSNGQLILLVDLFILLAAVLVYGNIDSALYGLLVIFTSTTVLDRVLYNAGMGKMLYIVCNRPRQVADQIMTRLKRGVTLLPAVGGFTGKQGQMLLCVVRRGEVWRVSRLIKELDENAFVMIADAGKIMGQGFEDL